MLWCFVGVAGLTFAILLLLCAMLSDLRSHPCLGLHVGNLLHAAHWEAFFGQHGGLACPCRKRAMERSQQRRLAAQQQRMHGPSTQEPTPCTAAAQSQAAGVDGAREEGLCVVCIESRADTVFLCGHMCVCELCATGLQSCPICRRRSRPIRVFQT